MTKWSSRLGGQLVGNLGVAYITRYKAFLELRSSLSARIKSTEYTKELGNLFIYLFSPLGIPYQPKGIQKGFRQLLRALPM